VLNLQFLEVGKKQVIVYTQWRKCKFPQFPVWHFTFNTVYFNCFFIIFFFSNQFLGFYVTFNVVKVMLIAFLKFQHVTMMLFTVMFVWMTLCSFFILVFTFLRNSYLWRALIDRLTLITAVIDGCQCITIEQNRY